MELPQYLLDSIIEKRAILFLGSGAAIGAAHSNESEARMPTGQTLANIIAGKFLGPDYLDKNLDYIAELSISESSLLEVQSYLRELFEPFNPAGFHMKIPNFAWKAIYTTNYDLIVEKTYSAYSDQKQDLVVFTKNGQKIEELISSQNSLPYYKLHGCISDINNQELPLILTPEQYINHRENRSRLFSRLKEAAYEYPIIFIGYSLQDLNIRAILKEIDDELGQKKMRSFLILPDIRDTEKRYWESKKITCLQGKFEDFISALDQQVSPQQRSLSFYKKEVAHPIIDRCGAYEKEGLSQRLINFLENDVEFIHKNLKCDDVSAKAFYSGYNSGFGPIVEEMDLRRNMLDSILSEAILEEERNFKEKQRVVIIKGHAGSGKSVLLRRLAWESAVEYEKLTFYVQDFAALDYYPLLDIHKKSGERLFLFVDRCSLFCEQLINILDKAKEDNLPITIVGTDRHYAWNIEQNPLKDRTTNSYEVRYLSEAEIDRLLLLLQKHNSLGYLEGVAHEERKKALEYKHGRQLLVALHEATMGKPFHEIIHDEYNGIPSDRAKSLYLTICLLHRLNVPVRAGLIARVHGISFTDFKEELFDPLEFVVFARFNGKIQDYVYQTRHPHIAEMVFQSALTSEPDRFDEYIRIIKYLDADYAADKDAFIGLTNAKSLIDLFTNIDYPRGIYDTALSEYPQDPMLHQQYAIAEFRYDDGNMQKAEALLEEAYRLAPWSTIISHSFAMLELKKANRAQTELEKEKHRAESSKIAEAVLQKNPNQIHPHHTLIKIGIAEIRDLIGNEDSPALERKLKDTERRIAHAISIFGQHEFILSAEAELSELLNDYPKALESMKAAFLANPRSPFIATRLAKYYEHTGDIDLAFKTIGKCLDNNPNDKDLHLQYAKLFIKHTPDQHDLILHHLSHSYTEKDSRVNAQFMHAIQLYITEKIDEADILFTQLANCDVPISFKKDPVYVFDHPKTTFFSGRIVNIEYSHGFIRRDVTGDDLFFHYKYFDQDYRDNARIGDIVKFKIAFTYRGPCAININK